MLRSFLEETERYAKEKGWKNRPETLFFNETGSPVDPDNLRSRYFYLIIYAAGLRHFRIHDLRHTFASILLAKGEQLAYICQQMGHSSIQVTHDLYSHLVPGYNRQAVDKLDDPGWDAALRKEIDEERSGDQPAAEAASAQGRLVADIVTSVTGNVISVNFGGRDVVAAEKKDENQAADQDVAEAGKPGLKRFRAFGRAPKRAQRQKRGQKHGS